MNGSKKNIERFYELIGKHLDEGLDVSEQEELEQHLLESGEKEKIFQDSVNVWNGKTPEFNVDKAWNKVDSKLQDNEETPVISIKEKRTSSKLWIGVAASLVAALVFVGYLFFSNSEKWINVQASSEDQRVVLPDNSVVNLRKGSSIAYLDKFKGEEREVKLSGEAFFRVFRNKHKPFVIHANVLDIKVLGTSFLVKEGSTGVDVMVKTGKVRVENPETETGVTLIRGEAVRYQVEKDQFEKHKGDINAMFWSSKVLVFENTSLSEVLGVVNEAYLSDIKLENQKLENCQITATFNNNSVKEIVEIICSTLNLKSSVNNNSYIISGESCK